MREWMKGRLTSFVSITMSQPETIISRKECRQGIRGVALCRIGLPKRRDPSHPPKTFRVTMISHLTERTLQIVIHGLTLLTVLSAVSLYATTTVSCLLLLLYLWLLGLSVLLLLTRVMTRGRGVGRLSRCWGRRWLGVLAVTDQV